MKPIVVSELGNHQVILSLEKMIEWGIVEPEFPKEMDGPWPFEKKKEEMSWIEEEYNCKVTEEEKKEARRN